MVEQLGVHIVENVETMKIIGVGLNRTGTTTLGVCLQHLGYRHTSMHQEAFERLREGDLAAVMGIMRQFDSFEDWPWPLVFRQIDEAYPDSRFILTKRESPDKWFESISRLAALTGPTEYRRYVYGHAMPQGNKSEYVDYYNRHNEAVEAHFRDKPGKLLVVSWEGGDGWEELCGFLGRDLVDAPFPHVNRSDRLEQMVRGQRS